MNIMFMGTPDFAVSSLAALDRAGHNITAVITTPDKPRGRGHKLVHTPVYEYALEHNIKVYTPVNLREENFKAILTEHKPDIIVVVAYGKLLPEYVLNYPEYGCVNVHGSLLPKYRGAAPIQRSIIDGELVTGVTTMYMEKGLDTGDMLLKGEVVIEPEDNFETLHDKLAKIGADLIVETISLLESGTCPSTKQDDTLSCYAHMITKETAIINWNKTAAEIHNLVRGLYPVPKAVTTYCDKNIKICKTSISDTKTDCKPGTIIAVDNEFLSVACGSGTVLNVLALQFEGKKVMSVNDYLRGNSISEKIVMGG